MNSLTRLRCHALIATTAILFTSFAANSQSSDAKIKAIGSSIRYRSETGPRRGDHRARYRRREQAGD